MRFAIDIPNFGAPGMQSNDFADPHIVAELAHEAEESGWDGFFIWDHIGADWPVPLADPWILLAAVALRTSSIRLGPMVTPLPRRRPWKLAREAVTLDHLSRGRLILGVGIGAGDEYSCFHEPGDDQTHGAMLDEGLQILQGLCSGERFHYAGTHYQIHDAHFLPKPVQAQIPIWVAGMWPNKKPFRRAAQWDGAFPIGKELNFSEQMTPESIREVWEYVDRHRQDGGRTQPYELVHWGLSSGDDHDADRRLVERYAAAGVTWWLENLNVDRGTLAEQRARIRKGPPRLS